MAAILKLYFKICSRVCYDCLSVVPGLYSSFPWVCVFLLLFLRIHFLCPVPHDKRLAICLQFYCPSHCPFFSSLKKMGESVFFLLIPSIVILIKVVEFSTSDPFFVRVGRETTYRKVASSSTPRLVARLG